MQEFKPWQAEEFAFIIFCRSQEGVTPSVRQMCGVIDRSMSAISMMWSEFNRYKRGDFKLISGNALTVFKEAEELHKKVTTHLSESARLGRWKVLLQQALSLPARKPHVFKEKLRQADEPMIPVDDFVVPSGITTEPTQEVDKVATSTDKPFFSINLDVDSIVRIIKAFKG